VKPVELPPEAEEQLAEFRALAAEAERVVASAQAQLREIARQSEAETARAPEVVHAMIDDKLVAADLVAEAWADCELATARARAQVLRAKATPAKGAADEIRAKGKELAALRREAKYTQWVLKLYEWHFPGSPTYATTMRHVRTSGRWRSRPRLTPRPTPSRTG
jgi:hypothetical protein